MSTYREIVGKKIKKVSSDPSAGVDGEMWYNSTTGTLRGPAKLSAWSSAAAMVTAKGQSGNFGTQTAAVSAAGYNPSARTNNAQEYNGAGWVTVTNYPATLNELAGAGTETAGLVIGGRSPPPAAVTTTTEYNGSSWTGGNALPSGRHSGMSAGTQTAAVYAFGRDQTTPTYFKNTFEYDGTNWTAGNDASTLRAYLGGFGTQTSAVACGGFVPPGTNVTEEYDGTNWTTTGNMGTARYQFLGTAGASSSDGIAFGGRESTPAYPTQTESYDGSTWSTNPATLGTGRGIGGYGPVGNSTTSLGFGGSPPSYVSLAEEFNSSPTSYTLAAWATSPALSYNVNSDTAASGSNTSAVNSGGYNAPAGPGTVSYIANAASWNGTAWTNITDMPERRTNANAVGATAPAYYVFGGANQPPSPGTVASYLTTTHTWNGSAWGSGPALAEGQSDGGGAGTPSAIVLMGGVAPPGTISNNIAEYNGSAWTNSPVNMPANMSSCGALGTATAAVVMGGYQGASPFPSAGVVNTYEWDGSSVSSGGDLVFGLLGTAGSGTLTAGLLYGGRNTAGNKEATCMTYNGTSWATSPSLGTGRDYIGRGPTGSQTSALAVAGSCPSQSLVEEYTGTETTSTNIGNFTTS